MRKRIAVLVDHVDHLSSGYEAQLRSAFEKASQELDLSLSIVVGRPVEDPDPSRASHNGIYDWIGPESVDGVLLLSGGLGVHCGEAGLRRFAEGFGRLPVCSFGLAIPGVPSIVIDNQPGMQALLEHLLVHHGHRRLAYLGGPAGNPDAAARFATYKQMLERHGVDFDPALVVTGEFNHETGIWGTETLLGRRVKFDALVAGNDGMAVAAMEVLSHAGIRVPADCVVTGFDDVVVSRLTDPPLTTVRQPLQDAAMLAMQLVWEQMQGRSVSPLTTLTAERVVRGSCGCNPLEKPSRSLVVAPNTPLSEIVGANAARLEAALNRGYRSRAEHRMMSTALVQALKEQLQGQSRAFSDALRRLIEVSGNDDTLYDDLQIAITLLRRELLPLGAAELEELWHDARRQVAAANTHWRVRQRLRVETLYTSLLRTGERFSTTLDRKTLEHVLEEELANAQIHDAVIALYAHKDRSRLQPLFCCRAGVPYRPKGDYSAHRLLPEEAVDPDRRQSWVMLPLTFEAEQLGVAVFELEQPMLVYDMLRDQLGTALKTSALHAEIVRAAADQERTTQDRVATAERLKSLSVLAGGVAHDLNNAFGPLVTLPDVMLYKIDRAGEGALDREGLRNDLRTLQRAAARAAQIIKDLLTLGRRGQVGKESIDLSQVVKSCLLSIPEQILNQGDRHVELLLRLCAEPLIIHGSEAHLTRAVANLVHNAVEAIPGTGQVVLLTEAVELLQPRVGYETIETGRYAVVSVEDTGQGIPKEVMSRIFEPFYSNKRLREHSGSGLGLAIVHGVVKEHDGFVDVSTLPGRGTTFSLYFRLLQR